jgi:hypothetical protein
MKYIRADQGLVDDECCERYPDPTFPTSIVCADQRNIYSLAVLILFCILVTDYF